MLAAKGRMLNQLPEITVIPEGLGHPVRLRLRTSDMGVFRQVLVAGEYECNLSKSPRVIVDAGANIGLASIFYATRYPQARVIAIEPEKSNYALLEKNARAFPNLVPVRGALWNADTEISLIDPGLGHYGFQTAAAGSPDSRESVQKVPGMTIEKVMRDYSIDYIDILKVDIEGSEKELFENSSSWIDSVGVIAIELHDRIRDGCSRSLYSAASGFTHGFSRGETTFLFRSEYACAGDTEPAPWQPSHPPRPSTGGSILTARPDSRPDLGQSFERANLGAVAEKG